MHRTLLLSPYYLPMKILRWEDAIKMRYEGTVDVVAEYADEVASPSVTWKMPAVVRLRRMPAGNKRAIRFSRVNVYQRDRWTCQYCGHAKPERELSFDHVVPRSSGGRTCWTNIVSACRACNLRKGNKSCDEAGMWPIQQPVCPRALPLMGPRLDPMSSPPEWAAFIPS